MAPILIGERDMTKAVLGGESNVVTAVDGVFAGQIRGAREYQEDALIFRSFNGGHSTLVVLADGMGGHQGGQIASATAIESFTGSFSGSSSENPVIFRLVEGLNCANQALAALMRSQTELDGMGTTLLAAAFTPRGVSWLSVGDSILFRVRGLETRRMNADHSMTPLLDEAVNKGALTREQALTHKDRNSLRSAVMGAPIELIDISEHPAEVRRGDVWLLASDGLLTLEAREIGQIVNAHKSQGAKATADSLLAAVAKKNKPRQDNTSVAVVLIDRNSAMGSSAVRSRLLNLISGLLLGFLFSFGAFIFIERSKLTEYFEQSKKVFEQRASLFDLLGSTSSDDEPKPIDLSGVADGGATHAPGIKYPPLKSKATVREKRQKTEDVITSSRGESKPDATQTEFAKAPKVSAALPAEKAAQAVGIANAAGVQVERNNSPRDSSSVSTEIQTSESAGSVDKPGSESAQRKKGFVVPPDVSSTRETVEPAPDGNSKP